MALDLALIGPPDIRVDGAPIDVDTRKAVAVLAYLAVEGGAHPRDRLVDLLWPGYDVDRARSSLRRTVSALRSALGKRWIRSDRTTVSLEMEGVSLDVAVLAAAVARHDHADGGTCGGCLADLSAAAALDRGGFMDGFTVRGAGPFELWLTAGDGFVRRRLDDIYRRLAAAHAAAGSYAAAARATERRIVLDPLREDAYRTLMLLHAWSGNRSLAVDTYRLLVNALETELGVPPLEETTEFYEAILEEDLPRPPAPPRPAIVVPPAPGVFPFVGRDEEARRVIGLLETPGSVVVVEGPQGIGVSRFLDEIANRLHGRTLLRASGTASGSGIPYGVLHEALFPILEDPPVRAAVDALPETVRIEASRLLPGLAPGASAPVDTTTRAGFLDALARVVAALDAPVLVVDDFELADAASAEAIAFFALRAKHLGLQTLVGVSEAGSRVDPATVVVLDDLRRMGAGLRLSPLGADAVEDLVSMVGLDVSGPAVLQATGGVPFLVVEALRSGPASVASDQVGRAIGARIRALGDMAGQVFEALVVLGRPSDPALVASVSGRSEDETDGAIDVLAAAGLVIEDRDGDVSCSHPFVAKVVADRLSAARRRLLNRRAVHALEAAAPTRLEPARIAAHHLRAGNDADAAMWFARAGDAASHVLAHEDAIAHYESAIAAGHPDRASLHRSIGHCAMLAGSYDRAVMAFEASLAAGSDDVAAIEHRLGEVARRLRRWDLAAAHLERAATADPDAQTRAMVMADLAYVETQRSGRAPGLAVEALELAVATGSDRAIARAENIAGLLETEPARRRAHFERALEHAVDPYERVAVLNNLAASSEPAEAAPLLQDALGLAGRLGDLHLVAALNNALADVLHALGRNDESITSLAAAVGIFSGITADGDEDWIPEVWFLTEW